MGGIIVAAIRSLCRGGLLDFRRQDRLIPDWRLDRKPCACRLAREALAAFSVGSAKPHRAAVHHFVCSQQTLRCQLSFSSHNVIMHFALKLERYFSVRNAI
jgi:hypothetical protein